MKDQANKDEDDDSRGFYSNLNDLEALDKILKALFNSDPLSN